MNEHYELGLSSYDVLEDGQILIVFTDNLGFQFTSEQTLDQDCEQYDTEVIENLRKYITCYCANFGGDAIEGKMFVFDLAEPNGNIVRIV